MIEHPLDYADRSTGVVRINIRQQDGSEVTLRVADTLENRWTAQYIARHEAYANSILANPTTKAM